MSLARGLSTTRVRAAKRKPLTVKEVQDYTVQWKQYNKNMRKAYLHDCQFDTVQEFIKYTNGGLKVLMPTKPAARKQTISNINDLPSANGTHKGALAKSPAPVYSGERKLVGIAIMHKSNLVPVFADENGSSTKEASELSQMSS